MAIPTSSSIASGAPSRSNAGSVLDRATRLAVMLVVAAAGLLLLQTYRALLHESPTAPKKSASEKAAATAFAPGRDAEVEKVPDAFLQPGAWSLGENNWSLAVADLSQAEGEARLQSLGRSVEDGTKPWSLEMIALDWLRLKRIQPVLVGGCRVYDIPLGSMRIRIVAEKQGRERLRLAQIIWRQEGSMRLLEASPAPASTTQGAEAGHLLPLPAGVASVARRWNDAGQLSCEILGPASAEECLRDWVADGWTAEKIENSGSPFSLTILRSGKYAVCLHAVETGPRGSPAYLLLTNQSAQR
jgi:hypothetical protein